MGGLYAVYAGINAAYRRTLNGVRSTGKKTPICLCMGCKMRPYLRGGTAKPCRCPRSTTILWAAIGRICSHKKKQKEPRNATPSLFRTS